MKKREYFLHRFKGNNFVFQSKNHKETLSFFNSEIFNFFILFFGSVILRTFAFFISNFFGSPAESIQTIAISLFYFFYNFFIHLLKPSQNFQNIIYIVSVSACVIPFNSVSFFIVKQDADFIYYRTFGGSIGNDFYIVKIDACQMLF